MRFLVKSARRPMVLLVQRPSWRRSGTTMRSDAGGKSQGIWARGGREVMGD